MLNVIFSWVSLWGALPLSAANVKIKPTERGGTFLYVTLRSFLRSRSEEEVFCLERQVSAVVFTSCLGVSSLWKIAQICQRSEILFFVVLLATVEMNSPSVLTMLNLLHPLLLLLCYSDLHSAHSPCYWTSPKSEVQKDLAPWFLILDTRICLQALKSRKTTASVLRASHFGTKTV